MSKGKYIGHIQVGQFSSSPSDTLSPNLSDNSIASRPNSLDDGSVWTIHLTKAELRKERLDNALDTLGIFGLIILCLSPLVISLGFIATDVFNTWWIAQSAIGVSILSGIFAASFIVRFLRAW